VELRFFIDVSTGQPHIYGHSVSEAEVEDVLTRPIVDRPGLEGSRVALGQTEAGAISRSSTFRTPCRVRCS
jgi:hypothetical protein